MRVNSVAGVAATKAKRKPVDSQLTLLSDTPKNVAVVAETGAKVSQDQETRILRRESWNRMRYRRR